MLEKPSGIEFPFRFSAAGGVALSGGVAKVKTNLHALVKTTVKERLIEKGVGTIGYRAVFRNNTASVRTLVKGLLREAITKNEPRVSVLSIDIASEESLSGNAIAIEVSFMYKETGDTDTFVTNI